MNPGKSSEPAPLKLTLTLDAKAEAVGCEIVERVRVACSGDDFDAVSTLLLLFPDVVPRVAEFHALMDELVRVGDDATIRKIYRAPGSRGRPRGDAIHLVAIVEHVMAEQKIEHVTDALSWLAKAFQEARERGETNLPWLPSHKTIRNVHARLAALFRLWSGSRFVRPELVTSLPWRPPGYQPEPLKLVATRLSRAIVFHSPEDKITEPGKDG